MAVVSVIIFFFAAELLVRLSGIVDLRVYDPLYRPSDIKGLVYELKPNFRGRGYAAEIKTNSYGLRDDEFSLQKPERTFRIIALGDSFTFGYGVERDETFVERLESLLNESKDAKPGIRFEVINCGVMGYNTTQERIFFETVGVKLQPDLVIVYTIDNDFGEMYFREQDGFLMRSDDKIESVPERARFWLAKRSHFAKLVFGWLRAVKKKDHAEAGRRFNTSWEAASLATKRERVNDLKRIALLSKERGAELLLVLHDFNKDASDFIMSALKDSGAYFLDTSPFWESKDAKRLVIKHDIHPNKDGHLFIARKILDKLMSEKLVPQRE